MLIVLFTLLGIQQRIEKPRSLVLTLNEKDTLKLIEMVENSGNEKLITDLICDHVKCISYDNETKSTTIIFKKE
jgi:hypothetical protein